MPKRITLTEEQKSELCAFARVNKKNRSQYIDWIENKWSLRVDESTISRILKISEERLDNGISNSKTKRHRAVTYPELDLALKEFMLIYQHRTVLTDALLVEKAKVLADGLRISQGTLNFSPGWLYKFKNQNGIRLRQLQGEAASADMVAINNVMLLIKNKCASYPPERIYNIDETRLFYRYKSLINGSHKIDPLVIGKYKKLRCFKNIRISNLPMKYRNSAKAWMIISLFHEWILEFDCQVGLKYQGQRVLLRLDNCPSHDIGSVILRFTEVLFCPKHNLKDSAHGRRYHYEFQEELSSWMLQEVENGQHAEDLKMNVLQAIHFIIQGWDEVKANTIRNCWYQTKILSADTNSNLRSSLEDFHQTTNPVLNNIADALNALDLLDPMQVEEYLAIPEENIVYEVPSNDQVITELDCTEEYVNLVRRIEKFIKKTK
ncbi:18307_t:CDS:2, partial [Racocetra persica]